MTRLVLWDLDGTLVDAAGLGGEAFAAAIERLTGRPPTQRVALAGRTDAAIALDLLAAAGVADPPARLAEFEGALAAALAERAAALRRDGRALPGAAGALRRLAAEPGVAQSVLTGNIEANARLKLACVGLDGLLDLDLGAFGAVERDRAALVTLARERARTRRGLDVAAQDVVLVGDTPHDVAAALATGSRAVGVATGQSPPADLAAAGAHAVLDDLTDAEAVVRAVLDRVY